MDIVAGHGQLEKLSTKVELEKCKSDEKYKSGARYSMHERVPSHNGFFNSPDSADREETDVDFARYAEPEMSVDDMESVLDSPYLQKKSQMSPLERISSLQGSGRETLSEDDLEHTITSGESSFEKAGNVSEGEDCERLIEGDVSAARVKTLPSECAVETLRDDSAVVSLSSGGDSQRVICAETSRERLEKEGNESGVNGYQDVYRPGKGSLFEERPMQSEAHVEQDEELNQSPQAAAERTNIVDATSVLVSTPEEGTKESKRRLNPSAGEPISNAKMESDRQGEDDLGRSENTQAVAPETDRLYEEIVRELDGINEIKTRLADENLLDCFAGDRSSPKLGKDATIARGARLEKAKTQPECSLEDTGNLEGGVELEEKYNQNACSEVVSSNNSGVPPVEEADKDDERILLEGPRQGVAPSASGSEDDEEASQEATVAGIKKSMVVENAGLDKGGSGLFSDSIAVSERSKVESERGLIQGGCNSPAKLGTEKSTSPRKEGDKSLHTRDVPTAPNGFTVPEAPLLCTSMRARRVLRSSLEQDEKEMRKTRMEASSRNANSSAQNGRYLTVPKSPFLSTTRRVEKPNTLPKIPTMKTSQPARPRESSVTVPRTPALVSHTRSRNTNLRTYESIQLESIQQAKTRFQELRARTQASYKRVIANDTIVPRKIPPARPLTASRTPNFRTSKRAAERSGFQSDREKPEVQIVPRQATRAKSKPKPVGEMRKGVRMPTTTAKTPKLHTRSRAATRQIEAPAQKIEQDTRAKPRHRWTGHTVTNPPRLSQSVSSRQVEKPEISEAQRNKYKARPMPHYKHSKMIPKVAPKVTCPEPFRLSETNRIRSVGREEESPKRGFRARKVPTVKKELPSVKARLATVPTPFNLISEELHQLSKDSFESHVDQEEAEKRDKRCFHARPLPDLNKVWKPEIQPTNAENLPPVTLHSDKRAVGRYDGDCRVHSTPTCTSSFLFPNSLVAVAPFCLVRLGMSGRNTSVP
mmetsp:Transcript_28860/g.112409  ORF Transcript_28860/g.112409 Transcript_28860/m.112409 type:complete len:990 (-) Transcript_28860:197-3166(-)